MRSKKEHPKKATPHEVLLEELLNSNLPKTEREHAAAKEIKNYRDFVAELCPRCLGTRTIVYGTTSTYRGGAGGTTMTEDWCDKCWGSGKIVPWASLRSINFTLEEQRKKIEELRNQLVQCRMDLISYGAHSGDCSIGDLDSDGAHCACSCGYEHAIAASEQR